MAEGDQVTQTTGAQGEGQGAQGATGDQGQGGGQQGAQDLGWRAALPNEFKEHEYVKTFNKPGDFVKSALEVKTERDALKTRMEGAIFKPGENAKPEEIAAYRKAMGVPEKATEYQFPATEGRENAPEMVSWAQKVFHEAGLSGEQAAKIGAGWNEFLTSMVKANDTKAIKDRDEATVALKKELGSEEKFKESIELTGRLLKAHATPDEMKFLDEHPEYGNHPLLIRLITKLAQKTGEDISPQGSRGGTKAKPLGMNYETMGEFK